MPPEELPPEEPPLLEEVVLSLQTPTVPLHVPGLFLSFIEQQTTSPLLISPQNGKGSVEAQSGSLPESHNIIFPAQEQHGAPPEEDDDEEVVDSSLH